MNNPVVLVESPSERIRDSRDRILVAGLDVFSEKTLHEASVRLITERAGVNLAAISYHFGNKEGLYRAVIEQIIVEMRARMEPTLHEVREHLNDVKPRRKERMELLKRMLRAIAVMNLGAPKAQKWAKIIVREQMAPTFAFDMLYEGFIRSVHETLSALIGEILGVSGDEMETIIIAHTVLGQVLAFRFAHEAVLRRLGKSQLDENVLEKLFAVIDENLSRLFEPKTRKRVAHQSRLYHQKA